MKPGGMTLSSELEYDGTDWHITDRGSVLATYPDDAVRLSLSWKAKLYRDDAERVDADAGIGLTIDEAIERLRVDLSTSEQPEELAADTIDSQDLQAHLMRRYSAYAISTRPA